MLIEFRVSNFRSIREEQTLSLVASNYEKELPEALIDRPLPGLSGMKFLSGAAIYGANASGKSNILKAIAFLRGLVADSAALKPGEPTGTEPFKLSRGWQECPSSFELTFEVAGVRYQFYVALTAERIVEESLVAYPAGLPQRWYSRRFAPENNSYAWAYRGRGFKVDKSLQAKTKDNSLFLSTCAQWHHVQLEALYNAIRSDMRVIQHPGGRALMSFSLDMSEEAEHRSRLLGWLKLADPTVAGLHVEERDIGAPQLEELRRRLSAAQFERLEAGLKEENVKALEAGLLHQTADGDQVLMDLWEEESLGTQRFYALLGPWIDILENGYTVFVDEIEASLHPLLLRWLLQQVFNKETNPNGAQVVFTTHSSVLLDASLLRRDQIWFTERGSDSATRLRPLSDTTPRKGEALSRGYLAGRYGAIPLLGRAGGR
jgi:hypothetical protein